MTKKRKIGAAKRPTTLIAIRAAEIFRQILAKFQNTGYAYRFAEREPHARVRHARLFLRRGARPRAANLRPPDGRSTSIRAIAASETLSVRRVQQIVREHLDRRNANPADDFALLQIARLERALDLIGAQLDAGKPSAAHAFVRILEQLNRLAPDRLRLKPAFQRVGDEVDKMEEKLERLDAAREALAQREAERGPQAFRENAAQSNAAQALDNTENGEMDDFAPSTISGA